MKRTTQLNEKMIVQRLEEAASTMRRLPAVTAQGYVSYWPEILYSERERYQMENKAQRCVVTPEQVERMEEACEWLRFLINIEDRQLLWLRAEHVSWKYVCVKLGIARATAHRRWKSGLKMIAYKLS